MNSLLLLACFAFIAIVNSQAVAPGLPPGMHGLLGPVPLPAMIPGIINPSYNPFISGPINGLMSNVIFNPGLLLPSPLLPFGRRAGVGKREVKEEPKDTKAKKDLKIQDIKEKDDMKVIKDLKAIENNDNKVQAKKSLLISKLKDSKTVKVLTT
jgi:hypothetical protein